MSMYTKIPKKILVIEDEVAICELLECVLLAEGYFVEIVHRGDEAVERLIDNPYDLILVDLTIPGTDSSQIVDVAKTNHPNINYIFMSGYDISEIKNNFSEDVAEHYISKPFRMVDISLLLKSILA